MTWRFRVVLFLFVFLFSLVISRLFYWQVVRADELAAMGQEQYGKNVLLTPERGEIKTSDSFAIAANKLSYLIFANPKEVSDSKEYAEKLSPLLEMEDATISALLDYDRFWIPLRSQVTNGTKEKIEKLSLSGVGFQEETARFYPEASMAAHLLGFVGKDENGTDKGYFGLEGFYDRQLKGKPGRAKVIHDAGGRPILANMTEASGKVDGRDLLLHVDRTVQFLLDRELKAGVEKYGAEGGMAGIIDPKTGGILALSVYPRYDPRSYEDFSDSLYRNPFITDTYEPGSTFKPLVMGKAIEEGLVKPNTRCDICAGPVPIGGYEIKTWNGEYYPNSTMTEVIQHSDNTGMVFVGRKLTLDGMLELYDDFGVGQLTGIDLQGETTPTMRPREEWYPIDLATATFGQGMTVTPIELLTAFTAVANEGQRMQPHVVKAVETDKGEVIEIPPKVLNKPISSKTAKIITEMMVTAVNEGEAQWLKPEGYRVAGKTGTAQIPVAGHYDKDKTITSFIGFAPADDPKFLMLVVVDRPTSSIYGAETAAPIFFNVANQLLTYYNIPPSE